MKNISDYVSIAREATMTLKRAFKGILSYFNHDYEKTITWFVVPNPGLGGISPIIMMMNGRTDKLCKFIENALAGNNP